MTLTRHQATSRRCASSCGRSRRSSRDGPRCGGPSSRASTTAVRRRASSAARAAGSRRPAPTRSCSAFGAGDGRAAQRRGQRRAGAGAGRERRVLAGSARPRAAGRDPRSRGPERRARAHRRASGRSGPGACSTRAPGRRPSLAARSSLKLLTFAAVRSDRRRADHLAAGMDRRQPQLGLPLHLAARRELGARRAAADRLPRRGARLLLVADARLAPDAAAAPTMLYRLDGSEPHARARAAGADGLPRLAAGANRQRGPRPGSARHLRLGAGGDLDLRAGRRAGSTATPARGRAHRRLRDEALARQGQRDLGGA